jgi:hypothetical protein
MAYDRADWHYGGDFPKGLPKESGGTHIGMFLAWIILRELEGELHREESALALRAVRERKMTGREFLFQQCDEKFTDEDLSDEGNLFTNWYYEGDGTYLDDYSDLLADDVESLYHVADSWENFDKLVPIIDSRFEEWKKATAGAS